MLQGPAAISGTRWKTIAGFAAILAYFFLLTHGGLRMYFNHDDVMNLVSLHGNWTSPWWKNVLDALTIVTPAYRPMGGLFYRLMYWLVGFHSLPFRVVCFAVMVINLGLFFRLIRLLSRSREVALLSTLIFSVNAGLDDLYFSTGTIYDILCVGFTLATLIYYVRIREQGHTLDFRNIVVLLLLCGGAIDSKEMAASLPIALLLYEAIFHRVNQAAWLRRVLPLVLAGALTGAALLVKVPRLAENPNYQSHFAPSFLLPSASHYINLLLFGGQVAANGWIAVIVGLALAASVIARSRAAVFGLWFGFLTLIPVAAVPVRNGFVLYLPWAGFALFAGAVLVALRKALMPRSIALSQTALFAMLAVGLFAWNWHNWNDQSRIPASESAVMREAAGLIQARLPTIPPGTRLLFLDDPLPKNQFTLLFLVQAIYHDPSISVERQNSHPTPLDPAEYAIFDYLITIRDGHLTDQHLPPMQWEGAAVPVSFSPGELDPGQTIQMRAGSFTSTPVDIEYRRMRRFSEQTGVALRWTELDKDGVATIPISLMEDPSSIQITAVRVSGDIWRKANGGFVIR